MKVSSNQLSQHLQSSLLPCYLVSGDEPLLVQEALDAIRQKARSDGFESRDLHVATTGFDWADLSASAGNLSLFAEKRIIELQLPTGKPGRQGSVTIVDMIAQTGSDILFIVRTPKLDRNTASSKWAKALEAAGGLVQVWPIGPRELVPWIHGRMRAAGLQPDRDAVRLIADRVEGNLLAAQQEIEKLRLICGEGPVTVADADAAVADSSRFDVYKLVDAAVAGDAKRALRILGGVRTEGLRRSADGGEGIANFVRQARGQFTDRGKGFVTTGQIDGGDSVQALRGLVADRHQSRRHFGSQRALRDSASQSNPSAQAVFVEQGYDELRTETTQLRVRCAGKSPSFARDFFGVDR